jgi:hypothetical protein
MVVYKGDRSTINYAISKQKNHRYNLVVFMNEKGGLLAKGLVRDGDTTQKVGNWVWTKDGYETLKTIQYSKSISLSAFDKNIQNPHTNFSINVLENGKWNEPIVDIIDKEKEFSLLPKLIVSLLILIHRVIDLNRIIKFFSAYKQAVFLTKAK